MVAERHTWEELMIPDKECRTSFREHVERIKKVGYGMKVRQEQLRVSTARYITA